MSATFGTAYAGIYDALYADKDYAAECDVIERLFRRYLDGGVHSVLDLGCGTGNHALRLAQRGYAVTGVDLSPEMLRIAREKSPGGCVRWLQGDVRDVDAGGPYDAALLMFAVLGYQHTNDDVAATFANARRHVRTGGLLLFDAWYGPGVLVDPPGSRARIVQTEAGPIVRLASGEIDVRRHLCTVRYRLSRESGAPVSEETHVVRFFFPMELEGYLEAAGFRLLRMSAFDEPDREPDNSAWNVLVAAQAA